MGAQDRPTDATLSEHFINEVHFFSFFQLVHLLERYYRPEARIGCQGPVSDEIVRFRHEVSLAFPVSDIATLESISAVPTAKTCFRVTTTFLGLYGTTSPLPTFYTEDLLWKDQEAESVRAFLDLFHHRLLSLFYRCWSKYRYPIQFEPTGEDEFSQRLFGLIGLGTPRLANNTKLPSVRLIRYAGLLTQQPHSASALEGILSDFFDDVPIRVKPCTGCWVEIQSDQRSALGVKNCRLSEDCSIGERVYSLSASFRISVGPMTWERFKAFLPTGEKFKRLCSLVHLFIKDRLDFDLELWIHGDQIPRLQLVSTDQPVIRLGWTMWLSSMPSEGFDRFVLLKT